MTTPIVVCSLEAWDDVWRRNQYLLDALLREDPRLEVLFVEPAADPLHELVRRHRPARGRGMRTIEGYGGRLRALQPTKLLPRLAGPLADALLRRRVIGAVRRLGWRECRLWINDPRWRSLATATGWPTMYDITDDWVEAERGGREHRRLEAADRALLGLSQEIVVCSPLLRDSKGAARAVTLIRNAVDVARYREPHPRPGDLPDVPVALYVGTLHEDRLDVDLVLETGERVAARGGRVVLVGPQALDERNSARLTASGTVTMLGARPKQSVPAYLQHAHALIVPHVVDRFTDTLDPIKLYEYLAVGRPVVSTDVAGFRDEKDAAGVTVVDRSRFADVVAESVGTWSATRAAADIADWSDRARQMSAVLARLGRRPGTDHR